MSGKAYNDSRSLRLPSLPAPMRLSPTLPARKEPSVPVRYEDDRSFSIQNSLPMADVFFPPAIIWLALFITAPLALTFVSVLLKSFGKD